MTKAFDKIAAGLGDAIAFADGDNSRVANPFRARLDMVCGAASTAWQVAEQQTLSILADTERALKRAIKRAETLPADMERVEIAQMRGPTAEFTGRLLAEREFTDRRQSLDMTLEIWETQGGALVAISSSVLAGGEGREDARVTIVPPTDDVQGMHFAVLDAFNWDSRARDMARKLGWSMRVEVA